jgi:TetR/AcrR family transcriptional regulator
MARPRASDHADKRRLILHRSAGLFAAHGYDRASMNMIAAACGVSKPLLYHYYRDKEELLFDVVRVHLEELVEAVEAADDPALPPEPRLRAMARALLGAYRDADAEHKVQIAHLQLLSPERRERLRALERALVARFAAAIAELDPTLAGQGLLKPLTMSLFGMLNWHYLWFREDGPLSRGAYADLAARLVVAGTRGPATAEPGRTAASAAE